MILEFRIKNFLSFKDEVLFNFEATKDTHLEGSHVVEIIPGLRISKLGIVYGANASGKSNLVNAFEYLHDFWFNIPESKNIETDVIPFLLDNESRNQPSEFTLIFYVNKKKHIYNLKLNNSSVISESLHYYPGRQPAEVFTRHLNQNVSVIQFNNKFKISSAAIDEINVKCLTNMSFFGAYNKVNVHVPEIETVVLWMKNQYMASVEPDTDYLEKYAERLILKDNTYKDHILKFLSKADFNIIDFNTKLEKRPVTDEFISVVMDSDVPNEEKERLKKDRTIDITKTMFTHKVLDKNGIESEHELPENLQSKGTLRTMGISGIVKRSVDKNAFMAIDEIESSLHPRLVEFILESFLNQSEQSQLVLTTHYDGFLEEEDLLRNDNIWFTSKQKDGSTELYSLTDFKGLNRISSLQKAYKYGKFGAIPNI